MIRDIADRATAALRDYDWARERDLPVSNTRGHNILRELVAEANGLHRSLRELHKPMHAVFNWSTGLRLEEPCPDCNGKAGVHPCGCWAEEDMEYSCPTCRSQPGGHLADWPCDTAKLIYSPEELEQ